MKIMLVGSGSNYSTTEVNAGLLHGLQQQPDVEVVEFDTRNQFATHDFLMRKLLKETGREDLAPDRELDPLKIDRELGDRYRDYDLELQYRSTISIITETMRYGVDAIVLVSAYMISDEVLSMMSLNPATPHGAGVAQTVAIFTESPYEDTRQGRQASYIDGFFVNDEASVDGVAALSGVPGAYLPMAYHPLLHTPRNGATPSGHDVVFVGVGYEERIALLEAVDWTGVDLGLYGDWRHLAGDSPLHRHVRGGVVTNEEAVELYKSSKVGLNLYRTCVDYWMDDPSQVEGTALNPRAFELAACRVPQITQFRPEWDRIFSGREGVFTDAAGLQEQLAQYLGNREALESLANVQHARVRDHSYVDRAARVVEGLREWR